MSRPADAAVARAQGMGGSVDATPCTEDQVTVRPLFVGVCGTDLQILLGERPDRARNLGHEGIVEVLDPGGRCNDLRADELYVLNPVHPARQDEVLGHSYDGLLQRLATLSTEHLDPLQFVPVPRDLAPIDGALAEPVATALYGRQLVERHVRPDSVVIFGAGPIGLLHALLARARGCSSAFVVTTKQERIRWAQAHAILRPGEGMLFSPEIDRRVRERLGSGADAAFVCTPARASLRALRSAIACLDDEGCVDLVGGLPVGARLPELPEVDLRAIRRANHCGAPAPGVATRVSTSEGRWFWLTGHRGTSREHILEALALLRDGQIPLSAIISHVASLGGALEALDGYRRSRSRKLAGSEWVKLVVDVQLAGDVVYPFMPGEGWGAPA